jgi:serine/threonine protein kinase
MDRVEHPNIVELLGFGIMPNGNYFIVMDFMEDGSLDKGL